MKIKNWFKFYDGMWEHTKTRAGIKIKQVDRDLYKAYMFPAKSFQTIWISIRPQTLKNAVADAIKYMKTHP